VVVRSELFEGPVGDVLAAVGAVFGVGVSLHGSGPVFNNAKSVIPRIF
jgi:hypothetical protein